MTDDGPQRHHVEVPPASENSLKPRQQRELLIALADAESEFAKLVAARDSLGMKLCNEKMVSLEAQLVGRVEKQAADVGSSSSAAGRLVASLEATISSDSITPLPAESRVSEPPEAGLVAGEPLSEQQDSPAKGPEVSPAEARNSLVKAVEVASQRERRVGETEGEFDKELTAAFALKNMVEHTSSFMSLFFDPNSFIKNQLSKRPDQATKRNVQQNDGTPQRGPLASSPGANAETTGIIELESTEARDRRQLAERLAKFSFYEILSVDETASAEDIRKAFVKRINLLQDRSKGKGQNLELWRLEEFKKALARAEKFLTNSKARRSYDLSLTGLHDFELTDGPQTSTVFDQDFSPEIKLDMPKLLVFAGVLTNDDLARFEIGNFNSDIEFADKLVKLKLITYEEYNAAVLARSLVEKGKLSLGQTRFAFSQMRNDSIRFIDTIVAEGWLTSSDLPRA